jgi:O-antigen biosynthesis protein WbqP
MTRSFDIIFATLGLILGLPFFVLIIILGLFDTGSPIFIQVRVGKHLKPFKMVKFRTMKIDTDSVASHLASRDSITRMGVFLRKSKLDELPQLWNVLVGEMSLVGPRPNLFNQIELIEHRNLLDIYRSRPGVTGLAQISGVDMSTPELLAATDNQMLKSLTVKMYFSYIISTALGRGVGDRVYK